MALTANEQYLVELINRARLDPMAEAERYGLSDLNRGLDPGTITIDPKQVLAGNDLLNVAAAAHSQWMLDNNTFSHTGAGGSSPTDRAQAAGYPGVAGENISLRSVRTASDFDAAIDLHHRSLFLSDGHRSNILASSYLEIGVSQLAGQFTWPSGITTPSSMLTEKFGIPGDSDAVFLTGVTYNDGDGDAFYSRGEGVGGIAISISGGGSTVSAAAGGYSLAAASGINTVAIGSAVVKVDLSDGNGKLDLVNGSHVKSSVDLELVSGVSMATLLGAGDLSATGSSNADVLVGNHGNNILLGGFGDDKLFGGRGIDLLKGGHGNDLLRGGGDLDVLRGGRGNDTLIGHGGNDRLFGGPGDDIEVGAAGADQLKAGLGHDVVVGGGGNDWMIGSFGDDELYGGRGVDVMNGGPGDDLLKGRRDTDVLRGSSGDDALSGGTGNDRVYGGPDDDSVVGGSGNDLLKGGRGSDTVLGGAGKDMLIGGPDNDALFGGEDADRFVFAPIHEMAAVKDFEDGVDLLDLRGFDFSSLEEAMSFGSDSGGDAVFDFADGERLTVEATTMAQLGADDIII